MLSTIAVLFLLAGTCIPAPVAADDTSPRFVPASAPDLVIETVTWLPEIPLINNTVTFTVTIKNRGGSQSDASRVAGNIDNTPQTSVTVGPIAAGATATTTYTWKAQAGSHTIRAAADALNQVNEGDETNNSQTFAFSVLAPDLVIQDITWSPASPSAGDIVTFTVSITNQGSSRAGASNIGFYIDGKSRGYREVPGIEADATAATTYTWKAQADSHTIRAVADVYNQVKESNEDNNDKTIIYSTVPPDLVIQDITWSPASPSAGDNVTFTVTIKNQGSGKAYSAWAANYIDDVYQSSAFVGEMEQGSTATENFTWVAEAGLHTIKAVADYHNRLVESDKTNNSLTVVLPSLLPDLIIQDITWSPTNPLMGRNVRFAITVKNQGKSPAGNSHIYFYCDGRYRCYINYLEAGAIANVTIPWTAQPGSHIFRAVADAESLVNESNESNNEKTINITFSPPPLPDFIVQDIICTPENPSAGDTVTCNVSVKNQGQSTAGPSHIAYYVDDVYHASFNVNQINVGDTATVTFNWIARAGSHTIKTVANSNHEIYESDETNNTRTADLSPLAPDLIIQDITGSPASPSTGEMVLFTVTIKNQGDARAGRSYIAYYIDGAPAGFHDVPGIDAGATVTRTFIWMARAGSKSIRAVADDKNSVIESNELNNEKAITFPTALELPPSSNAFN